MRQKKISTSLTKFYETDEGQESKIQAHIKRSTTMNKHKEMIRKKIDVKYFKNCCYYKTRILKNE